MSDNLDSAIAAMRRFNRFYTKAIGVLDDTYLQSDFSLAAGRVLFELAQGGARTTTQLREELRLDAGYLSRILKDFERRGFIRRTPAPDDARARDLALTPTGRQTFTTLNQLSQQEAGTLLAPLDATTRQELTAAMGRIEEILAGKDPAPVLRDPRIGDYGWVVQAHAALYAREYGWDERFEALVAEIVAAYIQKRDPQRERCWIAEQAGRNVGSILLVKESEEVAKLRLLLVEPAARGHGLGRRLIGECVAFARAAGYRRITLWTQQDLTAARRLYAQAGFTLTRSEPYSGIGPDLVSEFWDLDLVPSATIN